MGKQIDEICAVDLKAARSGDEMVKRLKEFEHQLRSRELEQFIQGPSRKATPSTIVSGSKRESRSDRSALLKSLVDDLGLYIDLCLARFLVWRETRSKRKACNKR